MPIVDGLTSAKMIRSFEKSHPTHLLSTRASLNGRVPIIAVSASLIEKDRQIYIDAGFDGWILKPISLTRLGEIMNGIVDKDIRRANLYQPGHWEIGGWFNEAQPDVFAADTQPSDEPPMEEPSKEVRAAADTDDPFVKEEDESVQSREQIRMAKQQEQSLHDRKYSSMPNLSRPVDTSDEETGEEDNVMQQGVVSTPQPMSPDLENR